MIKVLFFVVACLSILIPSNIAYSSSLSSWEGMDLYTKVNLRFVFKKVHFLHMSTNFLKYPVILPVGTRLTVADVDDGDEITLKSKTGQTYLMKYVEKHSRMPFADYYKTVFSTKPISTQVKGSSKDKAGVKQAVVIKGMTRKAVFLAVGYPPKSLNNDLKGDELRYQYGRFGKINVTFKNDLVSSVDGYPEPEAPKYTLEGKKVFNRYPLRGHFEDDEFTIYSTNYIEHSQHFPINSLFKVTDQSSDSIEMTLISKGWKIELEYRSKHNQVPFKDYLKMMFSETKTVFPKNFTAKETKLIKRGRYEKGMSRKALFYSIGQPPRNLNSDLYSSTLVYMKTIGRKKEFTFDGSDKLISVK